MTRIDTRALKRDHSVTEGIERYGIELRPSGHALLGRCPFHKDGGRANLYVYPGTQSWYCYRCSVGGDVISFVQRIEGVGFRDAVERLIGGQTVALKATARLIRKTKSRASHQIMWGPDERACLAAAVELYYNRLLTDPAALAYLHGRGLNRDVIDGSRLGYAAGDELTAYLRWRGLPVQAAMRVGLLGRGGREFLAGRVVVPEMRGERPIWLVGRAIDLEDDGPKYLALPGPKPLLGWEAAKDSPEVFLVEGVFDWLTLLSWGYTALALVGTHVRPAALNALARFERVFLVLDNDEVGRAAAYDLSQALSNQAVIVTLPGVKDAAELATVPEGRHIFSRAVGQYTLARAA
jgi:DNA primase